jgi:probable rRNA maturation factor
MKRSSRPAQRPRRRRRVSSTAPIPPRPSKNQLVIDLANRQNIIRLSARKTESLLRRVLRAEGVTRGQIEVALVDDEGIRELHRTYLKIDTPTDVLTFQLNDPDESLAGLVVVSAETAAREAARYGQSIVEEALLYAIHGVLHLCGYDDIEARDARRMRLRQIQLLREFVDTTR